MPDERTALQECLRPAATERGLDDLERFLALGGLDLDRMLLKRMERLGVGDFVFLDAGCGAGHVAEEFARKKALFAHLQGFQGRIRSVGLDLNPLPSPQFKTRSALLVKGDIQTMRPLHPSSIDLGVSMRAVQYVEDHLQAFMSGWSVLKPGGTMVWDLHLEALTSPCLEEILAQTPEADRIFKYKPTSPMAAMLICHRTPGLAFKGFPFKRIATERPYSCPDRAYRSHLTVSHYERL